MRKSDADLPRYGAKIELCENIEANQQQGAPLLHDVVPCQQAAALGGQSVADVRLAVEPLVGEPMELEPLTVEPLVGEAPNAGTSAAEQSLAVESLTVESLAVESLAVESLAVESLAVESLAVESLAVESLAVEPPSAADSVDAGVILVQTFTGEIRASTDNVSTSGGIITRKGLVLKCYLLCYSYNVSDCMSIICINLCAI